MLASVSVILSSGNSYDKGRIFNRALENIDGICDYSGNHGGHKTKMKANIEVEELTSELKQEITEKVKEALGQKTQVTISPKKRKN